MRRNGGLWMVTFATRQPEFYDELPLYFRTRKAAQSHADWYEAHRNTDAWSWREDDTLIVAAAPDDIRADDIAWDYEA